MEEPKRPQHVKNAQKRRELHERYQLLKAKYRARLKAVRRRAETENPALREKRQKENAPLTLEGQRPIPENRIEDMDDPEFVAENEHLSDSDKGEAHEDDEVEEDAPRVPKILITTNRGAEDKEASKEPSPLELLVTDLIDSFAGYARYVRRPSEDEEDIYLQIKDMAAKAAKKKFTHLLVLNINRRQPIGVTMVHLPKGPSIYLTMNNYVPCHKIYNRTEATGHIPELVLNNFSTTQLGHSIGSILQSLWPPQPELAGRQVVTFHNQRDFIFFRRHRYLFRSEKKVALQEIGPRFTLKAREIQSGIWDNGLDTKYTGEIGQVEWKWHPRMEQTDKDFHL